MFSCNNVIVKSTQIRIFNGESDSTVQENKIKSNWARSLEQKKNHRFYREMNYTSQLKQKFIFLFFHACAHNLELNSFFSVLHAWFEPESFQNFCLNLMTECSGNTFCFKMFIFWDNDQAL